MCTGSVNRELACDFWPCFATHADQHTPGSESEWKQPINNSNQSINHSQ